MIHLEKCSNLKLRRVLPSKGVEERYPALQDVTISHIGIPASASAKVAALMQADLVPKEKIECR